MALKAEVETGESRLEALEAKAGALFEAAKDIRAERSVVTADWKRSYRPRWRRGTLGGFLWEEGQIRLITNEDAAKVVELLLPHLPDDLPEGLLAGVLSGWCADQGARLAERGAEALAATDDFFWNIDPEDWQELEAAAQALWTNDGGGYLKAMVDSVVDACGAALEVVRSGVLAEARDLRKNLKADLAALATRLQSDAQEQVVLLQADLVKLGVALERLEAEVPVDSAASCPEGTSV